MKDIIESYCGLECGKCEFKQDNKCKGCIETKGNPFYGSCKIAECNKNNNIDFCGECGEIPCEMLTKYSNDKENGDNPKGLRIERCKELKISLVKEARKGIEAVGYCGHHCDFCFMGQWCGGCRSNYNCCSYATLFDDKECPNVKCAKEKNLSGCYECDELMACKKGYYSNEREYVAKATALFIKKFGLTIYKKTLKNAIDNKVNYPKDFNQSGSVESALEVLEKYKKAE